MKNTLPILSTMALGMIAGITGTHFQQVSSMVKAGVAPAPVIFDAPASDIPFGQQGQMSLLQNTAPVSHDSAKVIAMTPPTKGRTAREDALLKLLSQQTQMLATMSGEQKTLRKQLADTNRDMAEITFRLDAQSSEFRPLNTQTDRPRGLISNPATNLPEADSQGLLPLKN